MVDLRQLYVNDGNANGETFVSVKDLRKEYQSSLNVEGNKREVFDDDDRSYISASVSVKDRLRQYQSTTALDTRQDIDQEEVVDAEDRNGEEIKNKNDAGRYKDYQEERDLMHSTKDTASVVSASICRSSALSPVAFPTTIPKNRVSLIKASCRLLSSSSPSSSSNTQHCFPPLTVSFQKGEEDAVEKEGLYYGNVSLRKVAPPVEDGWKKNLNINSIDASADDDNESLSSAAPDGRKDNDANQLLIRRKSLPPVKSELSNLMDVYSPSPSSLQTRESLLKKKNSNVKHKRHSSVINQSTSSLPSWQVRSKKDLTSPSKPSDDPNNQIQDFVSENEKFQKDVAAALKKVGPAIEERWKVIKNSAEHLSETSRSSLLTNIKLKHVGSTTSIAPNDQSKNSRRIWNKNREPNDMEEKSLSHIKRQHEVEVATKYNATEVTYGKKPAVRSRVSDLAKTFSTKTLKGSPEDDNEVSPESNEIEKVRNSLRSTPKGLEGRRDSFTSASPVAALIAEKIKAIENKNTKEAEGRRDSLSLSSPVAKLIAEKNKANSTKNSTVENLRKKFAPSGQSTMKGRRSFGSANTKSPKYMNRKSYLDRSTSDGCLATQNSYLQDKGGQPSDPQEKRDENTLERDIADYFSSNGDWESTDACDMFPLSFPPETEDKDSLFFNTERVSPKLSEVSNAASEDDVLLHSFSTISENTADSESPWPSLGESRYIQFALSSGGVTEKVEPNINIFMAPSVDCPSMASVTDVSSRKDRMKGLVDPLKGAKKFFFGKNNKKKMTEDDSFSF